MRPNQRREMMRGARLGRRAGMRGMRMGGGGGQMGLLLLAVRLFRRLAASFGRSKRL